MTVSISLVAAASAQSAFCPARLVSGPVPPIPVQAVGGGEVQLEVTVNDAGGIARVTPLRITPPFADALLVAVNAWQFRPAYEEDSASTLVPKARRLVASRVLVAGLFRPQTVDNSPTLGAVPTTVAQPSDEIPMPTCTVMPVFPTGAVFNGVVSIEVEINDACRVTNARVI